ncbi:MAG: hypothetical protein WCF20_12470 [Methylovirgula sp.]
MDSERQSADQWLSQFNAFLEGLKRVWPAIIEGLTNFAAGYQQYELLKQAGWVPHATTPAHLIDQCNGDAQVLSASIEAFYEDNWQSVRREIEKRVASYLIDAEAKAAVSEALSAHGMGLHRLVVRGLFPEVERVARMELYNGAVGNIPAPDGKGAWPVWNHLIRSADERLSPTQVDPRGFYAFRLFEFFFEHVYAKVDTPEAQKRFAGDPVPNRHGALHGLVVYRSPKESLNMIFMADFLLHVICLLKEQYSERAATAELRGGGSP